MPARWILVYVTLRPRPAAVSSTSNPRRLKRLTTLLTPSRLIPACCPAAESVPPAVTQSSALARRTASTRSLFALTVRCSSCSSRVVKGRKHSFTGLPIVRFLLFHCFLSVSHCSLLFAIRLPVDPLAHAEGSLRFPASADSHAAIVDVRQGAQKPGQCHLPECARRWFPRC